MISCFFDQVISIIHLDQPQNCFRSGRFTSCFLGDGAFDVDLVDDYGTKQEQE